MHSADVRSIAPVLGVVILLVLTICLGTVVAVAVTSIEPGEPPPHAVLELDVEGETGTIELEHRRGDTLDVTAIDLSVTVEGTPLDEQPPVPFFAADGFQGGPTGPFNEESEPVWRPGETASVQVASTNAPTIDAGDRVVVTVSIAGTRIAELETTAT